MNIKELYDKTDEYCLDNGISNTVIAAHIRIAALIGALFGVQSIGQEISDSTWESGCVGDPNPHAIRRTSGETDEHDEFDRYTGGSEQTG